MRDRDRVREILFVQMKWEKSSHGGLVVERWSDNRLDSATVDQIPLGTKVSMAPWPLTIHRP